MDIGETSYSMVLADDLNGDGRTDLLVTTMNGNVYAFQTGARHHPLASWTSQVCPPPYTLSAFSLSLEKFLCCQHPLLIHSSSGAAPCLTASWKEIKPQVGYHLSQPSNSFFVQTYD